MKENEYDHIMDYIDSTANEDTRKLISYFAILWNIYESNLFKKEHHIKDIGFRVLNNFDFNNYDNVNAINQLYNQLKNYLETKYVNFDYYGLKKYFNVLIKEKIVINGKEKVDEKGRPIYRGEIFERKFNELIESSEIRDKLHLLLIIVARVRNNMFHGIKKVETLDEQVELFEICNEILKVVLDVTKKNGGWKKDEIIKL